MIKVIDKNGTKIVQKITYGNNKLVRYQTLDVADIGNSLAITPHPTLKSARAHIGHVR